MLTVLDSETRDTNLGIGYSKMGLNDATADRFVKQNDIKQQNDANNNKIDNEDKTLQKNVQHTKLRPLGEILENRVYLKVQLVVVH